MHSMFAIDNRINGGWVNEKPFREFHSCLSLLVQFSNFSYLFIRKFCFAVFLSEGRIPTPFGNAVLEICFLSTYKKVVGITTLSVVTAMQNIQSGRYFSISQKPRKSVREPRFSFYHYLTIAFRTQATFPNPARAKFRTMDRHRSHFVYFFPKSLFGIVPSDHNSCLQLFWCTSFARTRPRLSSFASHYRCCVRYFSHVKEYLQTLADYNTKRRGYGYNS